MHHDGKGFAGSMPELGFLAETTDGAEGFELGEEALLDAVYLGEVIERFVGELRVGCLFENREEDFAGGEVVVLANGEDSAKEVGADGDRGIGVFREVGEDFAGLVVNALGHVGLANAELGVDGLGLVLVDVENGGELGACDVVLFRTLVIAGQEELHTGLIANVNLVGFTKLDHPAAEKILGAQVVLLGSLCDVDFGPEEEEFDGKIVTVFVKEFLVFVVSLFGEVLIAETTM